MESIGQPEAHEYAPYFERYVALVRGGDILSTLEAQAGAVRAALSAFPEARAGFRYAPGSGAFARWSGTARTASVFSATGRSPSPGEKAPLPAFDENDYARASGDDSVPLAGLVEEFGAVRSATLHLLRHLPAEAWSRVGVASGNPVSVRALAFIMAGHVAHHMAILRDRYGIFGGA